MIVHKRTSKAIGSVAEMQQATVTLEQAVSLMRERTKRQAAVTINEQELSKAMEEEEFFRPTVETIDDQFSVCHKARK